MYSLSLSSDPQETLCVKHGFTSVEVAENYLRKSYQAMDCMWVTIFDKGENGFVYCNALPNVVRVLQDGDSHRWAHIIKEKEEVSKAETTIGLSSLVIQLTGNRTAELNGSDKIDIVTPDGNHRFSIDEIRTIVAFWDATQTILNEA